ncbi:DedA family protein [Helicobacter sp. 11S02629-2]|uniref:DedA family protein n=1 Tax=Helicobacter sp. 11S02629-2 TaxID=1476195 RepID=UPI000BA55C57|nr:DedA family protein [Helicobacter sp. 11S02629-2]PAF44069.1 hypothetical protein BKH40_06260 [Helicobacter sp. 11S02629-2]
MEYLTNLLDTLWNSHVETWGYLILFIWSILEGEWGLFLAGLASYDGKLDVVIAILVAGLGGFVGDQIYFYIGRLNKKLVQRKLKSQRRKFALASLLMSRYGWPIIFVQRYLYGLRTVIPISIGLTKYSALKFAIINLISAWIWASVTILPAWYFGSAILTFFKKIKDYLIENPLHLSIFIVIIVILVGLFIFYKRRKYIKAKQANSK